MQNSRQFYLGMDVSKGWVDLALLPVVNHHKHDMLTHRFDNTVQGLKKMDGWLKQQNVPFTEDSLLVIENTGIYHRLVWKYCSDNHLPLHIGNAAHIKWSLGITRGKSDIIDSKRLCPYAYKQREELQATPVLDAVVVKLKDLMTTRQTLLGQKNSLQTQLKERQAFKTDAAYTVLAKAVEPALKGLQQSLKSIERQIKETVKASPGLHHNYQLLCTVPGIGHFTAVYLICCTANFAGKHSGKQLACYAGGVPFGSSSGTSIKGRNKVHKMANKTLKKMLHLGALSCIKNYPEFRDYYQQKKEEGKHPITILNAIRNKVVLRAAAVIKQQQPYRDHYQKTA